MLATIMSYKGLVPIGYYNSPGDILSLWLHIHTIALVKEGLIDVV